MSSTLKKFLADSYRVANDLKHRSTIKFNMSRYDAAVKNGMSRYKDIEKSKERVAFVKREALGDLEIQLLTFEKNIVARGAEVLWATNSASACHYLQQILNKHSAELIVKSKSMITEEIDFNHFVESIGITSVETDLGEYIVQIAGEKPYHIVTPAMHKSKKDVNELFNDKFGLDMNLSAEELTNYVRNKLRSIYQTADIGVTGANFIVANQGAIGVTENEGNAIMSTAFPKVHIVIAGIEKVIKDIKYLDFIWPVLATHGTGQSVSVYNSLFFGPKQSNEEFGPESMYVILLDNKRTAILNEKEQSDSLACIRCGACLNACPVYKNIGGYTYGSVYGGPIGSVISPFFGGFGQLAHLSYACSICGKCTEVCPSKIDLHMLLLHNRNKAVNENTKYSLFTLFIKIYRKMVLHSSLFDFGFSRFKNFLFNTFFKNAFGKKRTLPCFKTSFRKTFKNI